MKNISFVWSCIVMTFFVACQQAEVENPKADDMRMSISASIKGQGDVPESRYASDDGSPNTVKFAAEDAIGIFIDGKPADEWVYNGKDWASVGSVVYWPSKTKSHTFHAFYPYEEASDYKSVPMPSLLEQDGSIEKISACDFLVATKSQSYTDDETVTFNKVSEDEDYSFKHVSTLLQLAFEKGKELDEAIINKVTIAGTNIVSPSTYSFDDGSVKLTPDDASDVLTVSGLTYEMSGGESLYFIVNEKTDASSKVTLAVEYTVNGKTYEAKAAELGNNLFEGGTCQTYTITVQNDLLVVSGGTISPWGEGGSFDDIVINGEEKTEE